MDGGKQGSSRDGKFLGKWSLKGMSSRKNKVGLMPREEEELDVKGESVEGAAEKPKVVQGKDKEESEDEGSENTKYASKMAQEVLDDLCRNHISHSIPTYRMDNRRRGTAAIFNIGRFKIAQFEKREGYLIDGCMMKRVWSDLGFDVKYHEDLSTRAIQDALNELTWESHFDADCFVLVFMSHGELPDQGDDIVYSTDGPVSLHNIIDHFKADNTPSLKGKPRLFFIQACRGSKVDRGVVVQDIETDAKPKWTKNKILPVEADILLSQSAVREYASFRDSKSGSVYIKYLAHALSEYGKQKEMHWILTKVNSLVAEEFTEYNREDDDVRKQMPAFTSMLTKQLIFKKK